MSSKKSVSDYAWEKRACARLSMRIRRDSGLLELLEKTGQSVNSYIVAAIREKLIRDGYLKE